MRFKILITLLLSFACVFVEAQIIEKTKHFEKTFALEKNSEINIINKYGNIHLVPWEKDSVYFDAALKVRDNKQSKIDKLFDNIEVTFSKTPFHIIAQTEFKGTNAFWNEFSDLTKSVLNSESQASIDYFVYLPSWVKIKISNRFGNVYVSDYQGHIEVVVSNGNFQAMVLNGESVVDVEFGSAVITHLENANVKLNFAEFDLKTAENIQLESRSSEINVEEINVLKMDSKRDRVNIVKLGWINGTASFSRLKIEELNNSFLLSTEYGNVELSNISAELPNFKLTSYYTNVSVYFANNFSSQVEIIHNKKCKINPNASMKETENQIVDGESEKHIQRYSLGKSQVPLLKFELTGGNISFF